MDPLFLFIPAWVILGLLGSWLMIYDNSHHYDIHLTGLIWRMLLGVIYGPILTLTALIIILGSGRFSGPIIIKKREKNGSD